MKTERDSTAWLIDIGNTSTKCASARGTRVGPIRRFPTSAWTAPRWQQAWRRAGSPSRIVACCVVPAAGRLLARALPRVHFLSHTSPLGIRIPYPKPASLGADRLANAAAAAHFHGTPAIAISFGTAVTFDLVDARGRFLGGVIAPGLSTLALALHRNTALLPFVPPRMPRRACGRSTAAAIRSGVAIGFAGLASAIVDALRNELPAPPGRKPRIVATGGDAPFACRHVKHIRTHDPSLTLRGLALVATRLPAPDTHGNKRAWHAARPT